MLYVCHRTASHIKVRIHANVKQYLFFPKAESNLYTYKSKSNNFLNFNWMINEILIDFLPYFCSFSYFLHAEKWKIQNIFNLNKLFSGGQETLKKTLKIRSHRYQKKKKYKSINENKSNFIQIEHFHNKRYTSHAYALTSPRI